MIKTEHLKTLKNFYYKKYFVWLQYGYINNFFVIALEKNWNFYDLKVFYY